MNRIVKLNDGWYFIDEVDMENGPYTTKNKVKAAFKRYCEFLKEDN